MANHYDLVVIGTGTAAMVAALRVRAAGKTVAVIDFRPFGGTCALRGCDPKKMMVGGASAFDHARRMRDKGVTGDPRLDWAALMRFKRGFTDPVPPKHEQRYRDQGIATYRGCAQFTGRNTLQGPIAIAMAGLSEAKAREQGLRFKVNSQKASDWFTARQAAEPTYGFKVLVEEGSGLILGTHLVGPHADEVINLFAVAIRHGLAANDLKSTMFAYPTGASDIGHML